MLIDPDALAMSIDSVHPESRKVSAGKEVIKLAKECIQKRRDFSVESKTSLTQTVEVFFKLLGYLQKHILQ